MTTMPIGVKCEMSEPVRVYIERMKAALGVTTDAEAADALGISKQAIANWRRREKIPLEVELRLVAAYGPELAHDELTREVALSKEDRVVFSATIYTYSKYEDDSGRPMDLEEWLTLGSTFKEVEKAIRKTVREIGFEQESSETMLSMLIELIDNNGLKQLNSALTKNNLKRL